MLAPIKSWLIGIRKHKLRSALVAGLVGAMVFYAWPHPGAWHHYWQACQAIERQDFSLAQEHLARCLEAWPRSPSTHFLAARTARRCGRMQEAYAHLEQCRELGTLAEEIILERYLLQAQRGDLAAVEAKLLAFLNKEHADSEIILEVLIRQWMNDYRLSEALTYLERLLAKNPDDREALLRQGWVLERLENLDGAIQAYQKVVDLDPERDQKNGDPVRLRLAELLLERKQSREALEHLTILDELHPGHSQVLLGLARSWNLLGQQHKADQLFEALLKDRPGDPKILGERGRLFLEAARADLAETYLRQAAKVAPYDRHIVHLLAQCLERLNQKQEARFYQDRFQQIRRDEKKMRELMEELQRSPQDAWLRFQAAQIFLRNGLALEGEHWLLSALKYDPDLGPARRALADHYEKTGKANEAAALRKPSKENRNHR